MIKSIEDLHSIYVQIRFGWANWSALSQWALERLLNHEDNDDENIILLAGSSFEDDAKELASKILVKHLDLEKQNEEYWAGKFIVQLYEKFYKKELSIFELSDIIDKIYYNLGYPSWLDMLSRNCEYATDVESFEVPFHEEFNYITELWKSCISLAEFLSKYDRTISNTHDV
ncbi:hypothetical protein [Pseudomonas sp. WAC2]|uniref:hypothetical protein n=1 Tax=Pseudomonas sp. WAC2 TaxID=3055057 RepID=UPI0025AFEE97|nr:hypothetical protein [Pseudomonas sp. WAC2]MDN3238041.1 hypothetical protein [Pseudomonas sp. WAC2]